MEVHPLGDFFKDMKRLALIHQNPISRFDELAVRRILNACLPSTNVEVEFHPDDLANRFGTYHSTGPYIEVSLKLDDEPYQLVLTDMWISQGFSGKLNRQRIVFWYMTKEQKQRVKDSLDKEDAYIPLLAVASGDTIPDALKMLVANLNDERFSKVVEEISELEQDFDAD